VVDAVGDTFMSLEEWTEHQQQNRDMLTQLGQSQSPGKSAMEDSLKKRAAPVVRIDTTPRGPRAQRVQTWAQDLPVTPRHQETPASETESNDSSETTPDTTTAPALVMDAPQRPPCPQVRQVECLPQDFLALNPVDMLVLGDLMDPTHGLWLDGVKQSPSPPSLVIEFWPDHTLIAEDGPVSKTWAIRWEEANYGTTCRILNATQVGGIIELDWLMVIHSRKNTIWQDLKWPAVGPVINRAMNNCLRPANIPRPSYKFDKQSDAQKLLHSGPIPHCGRDPMPAGPGRSIETQKGVRRLLNDELARGPGTPKSWLGAHYPRGSVVRKTVAVHLLEYLSDRLVTESSDIPPRTERHEYVLPTDDTKTEYPPYSWVPPDLSPTSDWTRDRAYNLVQAAIQ
jgi:hypothetical protein